MAAQLTSTNALSGARTTAGGACGRPGPCRCRSRRRSGRCGRGSRRPARSRSRSSRMLACSPSRSRVASWSPDGPLRRGDTPQTWISRHPCRLDQANCASRTVEQGGPAADGGATRGRVPTAAGKASAGSGRGRQIATGGVRCEQAAWVARRIAAASGRARVIAAVAVGHGQRRIAGPVRREWLVRTTPCPAARCRRGDGRVRPRRRRRCASASTRQPPPAWRQRVDVGDRLVDRGAGRQQPGHQEVAQAARRRGRPVAICVSASARPSLFMPEEKAPGAPSEPMQSMRRPPQAGSSCRNTRCSADVLRPEVAVLRDDGRPRGEGGAAVAVVRRSSRCRRGSRVQEVEEVVARQPEARRRCRRSPPGAVGSQADRARRAARRGSGHRRARAARPARGGRIAARTASA